MEREFTFFQFLSWLFQLAYFVKASELFWSWISLNISKFMERMNFVIAWWRPSQNMKLGIFRGSRTVDGKEMYKKLWCTCKVVVLPCQAIARLTFSSPPPVKYLGATSRGKLSELENAPSCVLTRAKWAWSMLRGQNPSCVSALSSWNN